MPDEERVILDRIRASEESIKDAFKAHEERDQERFDQAGRALQRQTKVLEDALGSITDQMRIANGRLGKVETTIGIVEDREARRAKEKGWHTTMVQGVVFALVTALCSFLMYVVLAGIGVFPP